LKCADACTSGCISIVDRQLRIDASKCVGCGTCATVCPTGALVSRNPNDVELTNACHKARVGDRLVLICELAYQALAGHIEPDRCARVVCAGRIDESLLCELASRGVENVHILCGLCERCEHANGLETAALVIDTTHTLLSAWNVSMTLSASFDVPAYITGDKENLSDVQGLLADFFSTRRANKRVNEASGREPGEASAKTRESFAERMRVKKDGTLPHFIPDRRDQLLCSLSAMGEPNAGPLSTRLWGMVVIDDSRCSSCQMCATFCPTGALAKFEDEDGTFGVNHYPGDCVKCQSCKDICRENAITILDEVSPDLLLDGTVRRYVMKPREVELGSPRQMAQSMQRHIDVPIKDFS
jgi:Fe-S-cluster-containing hydrogenase component 2